MREIEARKSIEIPEGVNITVKGRCVTVSSEKGELTRDFSHAPISLQLEDNRFTVYANWPRKKEAALVGTICSHVQNMIKGVTNGFTYKLKIVFSHFPITVKVQGEAVTIQNFTGERNPRIAKIQGTTKVSIKDEDIIVQGINLEDVSQTAANIQNATKVKQKDPRVFLDGIYVFERQEGIEA